VHFQRYLAANCFGDTVGRGGIDLEVRELLTFSMLVALGGADAQVRGHVNGNLRVGNTHTRNGHVQPGTQHHRRTDAARLRHADRLGPAATTLGWP